MASERFDVDMDGLLRKPASKSPPSSPVVVAELVAGLGIVLILWAVLALLPHSAPFNPGVLLGLTLACWSVPTLVLTGVAVALLVALLVASETVPAVRPMRVEIWILAVVAVIFWFVGLVYPLTLDDRHQQEWSNGRLRLAYAHCDNVYQPCYHSPGLRVDDRTPANRTTDTASFLRSRVYGASIKATATLNVDRVDVVYGETGRAECAVSVPVPASPSGILLGIDGVSAYAAHLAARHGLAAVGVPAWPPASCGATGRIAVEAATTNAIAAAIKASDREISLYGCSRSGKIAVYAAATAGDDHPGLAYTDVFADSPGTMVASARHVGRAGEPFASLVDRWPEWLAADVASARDVARTWPVSIDAGDLLLGPCTAGTRYTLSSGLRDAWNNPSGLRATVEAARTAGCSAATVRHVESDGSWHCGLL